MEQRAGTTLLTAKCGRDDWIFLPNNGLNRLSGAFDKLLERISLNIEEILGLEGDLPRKTTTKKGKTDEKASLDRVGGKWIGFRSGAAF